MAYTRRITVEEAAESVSASGAIVNTWANYLTVWAKVEPLQGREYWSGAQTVTERLYVFKVRYSEAAGAIAPPRHRVQYGSRTYDIQSVIDFEDRHRELHIRCVQGD